MTIDTLKQAAQALREYARIQKGEKLLIPAAEDAHALAAALEAMAEQKPVARMVMEDDYWSRGHFYKGTRKKLKLMPDSHDLPCGAELYAAPIATPEHDAKVRDAALEEAAKVCDELHDKNRQWHTIYRSAAANIRHIKSTGADHAK